MVPSHVYDATAVISDDPIGPFIGEADAALNICTHDRNLVRRKC
jgi:hypothetical protein